MAHLSPVDGITLDRVTPTRVVVAYWRHINTREGCGRESFSNPYMVDVGIAWVELVSLADLGTYILLLCTSNGNVLCCDIVHIYV